MLLTATPKNWAKPKPAKDCSRAQAFQKSCS